jgi:SAM-dependent methyltransferase
MHDAARAAPIAPEDAPRGDATHEPGAAPRTCRVCGDAPPRRWFEKGGKTFYRCGACGYGWLEPLPTVEDLERHYAWTYSEGPYAVFAAAEEIRALIARDRLRSLMRALGGRLPDGPWLDVGASTGAFVAAARGAGREARGIELSENAVRAARERGLQVERARLEEHEPPAPLAVVTAFDTIEHLLDPAALLDRARRWLAPAGVLAMTLPDVASPAARLLGKRWYFYAPNDHFHYFDRGAIARLLARHGLRVDACAAVTKPLTLGYVSRQIEVFYPPLAAAGRLLRLLPAALLARPIRIPVGEMLVLARRED